MNKVNATYSMPDSKSKDQFTIIKLTLEGNEDYSLEIDNHAFQNLYTYTQETESTAFEFYVLSLVVYNIDKLIPRKKLSIDGWTREIDFQFPVGDKSKWNSERERISRLLSFLTGDEWRIRFHEKQISYYQPKFKTERNTFSPEKISLFSGGLDSLIGAYQLLSSGKKTLLVSHYDGMLHGPWNDQKSIKERLSNKFTEKVDFDYVFNRIGAKSGSNQSRLETTFRSRSILFLGMASYLAHNLTPGESFHIPENGTISLNIPLSPSRRSSCSTKTTHPYVLNLLNEIFSGLGINTLVKNPFELKTKGEMLNLFGDDNFFKSLVKLSNSCGKPGHKRWWRLIERNKLLQENNSPKHCGKCMPCLYRRAALHKVGLDDESDFGDNIFETDHWRWLNTNRNKRFRDVKTFLQFLASKKSKEEIKKELLINGSLPLDQIDQYSDVVIRTIEQIEQWINDNYHRSNYDEIRKKAGL